MGQREMALKYYLESLEMRKRLFKEDHPDTSKLLLNIRLLYFGKGLEYFHLIFHLIIFPVLVYLA